MQGSSRLFPMTGGRWLGLRGQGKGEKTNGSPLSSWLVGASSGRPCVEVSRAEGLKASEARPLALSSSLGLSQCAASGGLSSSRCGCIRRRGHGVCSVCQLDLTLYLGQFCTSFNHANFDAGTQLHSRPRSVRVHAILCRAWGGTASSTQECCLL